MDRTIPDKANRVLNIILLCLFLILIRTWYLSTVQYEEHLNQARKPQRRTIIEHVERAMIQDRFQIPLALNKIQYNAAVCYADIRYIPHVRFEKDRNGKLERMQPRIEYIKKLARLLGEELDMDPQKIEDTIHAKASLFPHTPFVIKENLSELQYYRLRFLEREWLGICMQKSSKRFYPQGKTASDVIGYLGAISSKEYYRIAEELCVLDSYLSEREEGNTPMLPKGFQDPLQVREHLRQIQEKSYTIDDDIGKTGVEAFFDSELRGYSGKKTYEIDIKGNVLRELPGSREAIPGQRLVLSISSELQEFAEQLLAFHEKQRQSCDEKGEALLNTPWMKGGAIVAMDSKTGEVLALASYPRIDPNDFTPSKMHETSSKKKSTLNKWLENEACIGEIWDGKRNLERERYEISSLRYYEEEVFLTWDKYLESILAPQCAAKEAMRKVATLQDALALQRAAKIMLQVSGQSDMRLAFAALYSQSPHLPFRISLSEENKNRARECLFEKTAATADFRCLLDHYLAQVLPNDDKLLILDLCHMLAPQEKFSAELENKIGGLSLSFYRTLTQYETHIQHFLYAFIKEWFHAIDFQQWRDKHFKEYISKMRKEERENKRYTRPYTEYLESKEKEMFKEFWETYRWVLTQHFILSTPLFETEAILAPYIQRYAELKALHPLLKERADILKEALGSLNTQEQMQFLKTMRSFNEMNEPLLGRYRGLRNNKGMQLEKHLASAFYPLVGFGYGRSQAFRQATPQGSVFKLIVAYQALLEQYLSLQEKNLEPQKLNPLTLTDSLQWHPRPGSNDQVLGYTLEGKPITRMYKGGKLPRSHARGTLDIIGAIEQSSNIYFSLLAAEHVKDPSHLIHTSRQFGFGEKSGIELPGEISGNLPSDLAYNKTGLYSFAIGQHSLIVTPLQTAVMMSAIANKGNVLRPSIVQVIAGRERLREYRDPFRYTNYPFQEPLDLIGIDFPLFTSTQPQPDSTHIWYGGPEVRRTLFFPEPIHAPLIEGMRRVLQGAKGTARPEIIRSLGRNPAWKRDYWDIKNQILGKTGTAEFLYKQTLDVETQPFMQNHIWFAGIAQAQTPKEHDIAVVVYLCFSEAGGKEAAPLAVEIVKKWREICSSHAN